MTRRQETYLRLFMLMGIAMIGIVVYLGYTFLQGREAEIQKIMYNIQSVLITTILSLVTIPAILSLIIYIGTIRDRHDNYNPMTK